MQNLITQFFDIFFPPHKDALLVRNVTYDDIHLLYNERIMRGVTVLSDFRNKYTQALIHEAKFRMSSRAMSLLGTMLDMHIHDHSKIYDACVPIPLSKERLRTRGYNQVHEILLHSKKLNYVDTTILKRARNTRPQTELNKEERLSNMDGAFVVTKPKHVQGKHILIVDDVMTTGATMRAAKAALLPHAPASVTCLALAH